MKVLRGWWRSWRAGGRTWCPRVSICVTVCGRYVLVSGGDDGGVGGVGSWRMSIKVRARCQLPTCRAVRVAVWGKHWLRHHPWRRHRDYSTATPTHLSAPPPPDPPARLATTPRHSLAATASGTGTEPQLRPPQQTQQQSCAAVVGVRSLRPCSVVLSACASRTDGSSTCTSPPPGLTSVNRGDRLQHHEERPASSGRRPVPYACRHSAVPQEGPTRLRVEQPSSRLRPGHGSSSWRRTQSKHGFRQHEQRWGGGECLRRSHHSVGIASLARGQCFLADCTSHAMQHAGGGARPTLSCVTETRSPLGRFFLRPIKVRWCVPA